MGLAKQLLHRVRAANERRAATEWTRRDPRPFAGWTQRYFGTRLKNAPSPLHRELEETLGGLHDRRGSRVNRLAPRGSAKTTWSTFSYPTYCALEGIEPHIVLAADSGEQSEEYVQDIATELQENEALRRDYWPAIRRARIKGGRIELSNGVLIRSGSTGKKIRGRKWRGRRPSLIVIDDPQSIDHIISLLMRDRSWQWLTKDVLEAGDPETNVIMLGTALHRECLVCRLQTNPGWETRLYRSIEEFPARMDLWEGPWRDILFDYDKPDRLDRARAFFEANKAAMTAGARVLWPDREPLYHLMLMRAVNGVAAFNSEKQNDPLDPSLCEWPAEYFDWPFWFDRFPETLTDRVTSVDPSKGAESRTNDYAAITNVGMDHLKRQFVEADVERRSIETLCADVCRHVREFRPTKLVIETNQFQALIKPILRATAKTLGVELPEIVGVENREPKPLRIRRLGPDLASRSVMFKRNSPGTQLLIDQLRDFPHGTHDDGPDAWEMGRRQLKGASNELVLI